MVTRRREGSGESFHASGYNRQVTRVELQEAVKRAVFHAYRE
jgi:hypothetical protein